MREHIHFVSKMPIVVLEIIVIKDKGSGSADREMVMEGVGVVVVVGEEEKEALEIVEMGKQLRGEEGKEK